MSVNRAISALAGVLLSLAAAPAGAETVGLRHMIVDPVTGFAIDGYDPVAYFAERTPRLGEGGHEWMNEGVAWRFANEGNMAAFVAAPDVYAPAFGGHCAVAVARGYAAEGDPRIWEIHDDRLYFFFSESNRQVFLRDPGGFAAAGNAAWPGLYTW